VPEHAILKYLKERRLAEFGPEVEAKRPGPVITISREYGCPGFTLAQRLASTLSHKRLADGSSGEWKAVNRDILKEVADHFELPESLVNEIYRRAHPANPIVDLFRSFSAKSVPGDVAVKKKIADIILKMATDGRYVIVGRGGAMLARNIPDSLHIQLFAPMAWRLDKVMEREKLSKDEALQRIRSVDQERVFLRKFYSGETPSVDFFDVTFNCATLTLDQMESAILDLLYSKKILESR
jgi:cytidylate kinase